MSEQNPWHQLFSLSWSDVCQGTKMIVEPEKDLSQKKQLLDLLLRCPAGATPPILPDGFDDLGEYNLITFKSYQEPLDGEALEELIGHYVNLRKQVSPDMRAPLPRSDFRLFAVCVRTPHNLLAQQTNLRQVHQGVHEVTPIITPIRVVVVHQLPRAEHNAMLLLFSAKADLLEYAARHYHPHSPQTSTLLYNLVRRYRQEGIAMSETLEQFAQRTIDEILQETPFEKRMEGVPVEKRMEGVPVEKRLEGIPVEKRLEGIPVEKRLEGVPVEKRLEGVPVEKRLEGVPVEKLLEGVPVEKLLEGVPVEKLLEGVSLEERMRGHSAEELEALLRRLRQNGDQTPKE